jgi:tetratricopeptide (TPR) repeat protein
MKIQVQCLLRKLKTSVFAALVFVLLVAVPLPVGAEVQMITATGEYVMGEGETPAVAKERALVNAMRAAAEQVAVYIENYCKTNNLTLNKDEVNIFSRGVVKVINKRYDEPKVLEGGFYYRVTITAEYNSDDINSLRNGMEDKLTAEILKKLQVSYDESQQELETLKKQLAKAQGSEVKNIKLRIAQNERNFTATQWFERGRDLVKQKAYNEAVTAFSEAISLNPQNSHFYYVRANIYLILRQYQYAVADLDKAIDIDPQNVSAYYKRGALYGVFLNQQEKAYADYGKVIATIPKDEAGYILRGNTYERLRQYENAIRDYDNALAINSRNVETYCSRAYANIALKQYDNAFSDCSKAIAIDPKCVGAYSARGSAYMKLGQYEQAIAEFDNVIAINPQNEAAYFSKGFAYSYLNRNQDAIDAFRMYIQYSHDQFWIGKCRDYIRNLGGTP